MTTGSFTQAGNPVSAMSMGLLALIAVFPGAVDAGPKYPSVDELPVMETLPDPFRFFGGDRRVTTRQDWEARQAEMMDLMLHYIYGPRFPQVDKYKVENRNERLVDDGRLVKYTATVKHGLRLDGPVTYDYYLSKEAGSHSILVYAVGREDLQEEEAVGLARRGYGVAVFKMGPSEKMAKASFPDVKGTRTMGWVWGLNEFIHYLDREHAIDKVLLTGCSRYGRVAAIAGALNKRVDLTAPITTLAHAVHRFDENQNGPGNEKWAADVYDTFAGKMNKLPVDRHFLGAVIAPRAYLGIMGAEKPGFEQGHVEAYDALVPVYAWLGARRSLGLYDHAPRGHGVTVEDLHTVLDFADMIFRGRKLENEDAFYRKNAGPVRYGTKDLDGTKEWILPPPLDP